MPSILPKSQEITLSLTDWRFDLPQEGSDTIVLTTYRSVEYCTFTNGNHHVTNRTAKGRILTKYECVAWLYKHDLQKAMMTVL